MNKEEINIEHFKEFMETHESYISDVKFNKMILDIIHNGELDKFIDNSVYKDKIECKSAIIYGMSLACLFTSKLDKIYVKRKA